MMTAREIHPSVVADISSFDSEKLSNAHAHFKKETMDNLPELSPQAAGEIASARLEKAINAHLDDINEKSKGGQITQKDAEFYDRVNAEGWNPCQELQELSGGHSIYNDHPAANRPLDAPRLPNISGMNEVARQENRRLAQQASEAVSRRSARHDEADASVQAQRDLRKEAERRINERQRFFSGVSYLRPRGGLAPDELQQVRDHNGNSENEHVADALRKGRHIPDHIMREFPHLANVQPIRSRKHSRKFLDTTGL